MSDRPRRIVLVDPGLRDSVGHHSEYDYSLMGCAKAESLEMTVLAHKDAARLLRTDSRVVPVFSEDTWGLWRVPTDPDIRRGVILHKLLLVPSIISVLKRAALALRRGKPAAAAAHRAPPADPGGRPPDTSFRTLLRGLPGLGALSFLILVNPTFYFELRKALARIGFDGRDLAFCHTATHHQLLEWALFAASLAPAPFPRVVLLLRYPPAFYYPSLPHFKLAFRLFDLAYQAGKLRLATDSERLAGDFAEHTSVPLEVLPIPHARPGAAAARAVGQRRAKICFASLGNARAEKGIVEIIDAIRLLRDTYNRRDEIEFFLQLNDPDKECAARVRSFLEALPPKVRVARTALSSDEYQSALSEADVVLLPYWRDLYASRTSGIFLEAVAAGKPVIVTADTWMTDELGAYGSGIAIPSHSGKALADAIIELHKNFENFRARAVESADSCMRRHSPTSLLHKLARAETGHHGTSWRS